jgi:hypothetical protein
MNDIESIEEIVQRLKSQYYEKDGHIPLLSDRELYDQAFIMKTNRNPYQNYTSKAELSRSERYNMPHERLRPNVPEHSTISSHHPRALTEPSQTESIKSKLKEDFKMYDTDMKFREFGYWQQVDTYTRPTATFDFKTMTVKLPQPKGQLPEINQQSTSKVGLPLEVLDSILHPDRYESRYSRKKKYLTQPNSSFADTCDTRDSSVLFPSEHPGKHAQTKANKFQKSKTLKSHCVKTLQPVSYMY